MSIARDYTTFADGQSPCTGKGKVERTIRARHSVEKFRIPEPSPTVIEIAVGGHSPGPGEGRKQA